MHLSFYQLKVFFMFLSYDVAFGSEITPCIKIDNSLVVYSKIFIML